MLRDGTTHAIPFCMTNAKREQYKRNLARLVARQEIGASQAVVMLYRFDNAKATLDEACAACGVPMACMVST